MGRDLPDAAACARFDKATKQGEDMRDAQRLLAAAVGSATSTGARASTAFANGRCISISSTSAASRPC
ncbi:MAG: hypothetical protein OZ922_17445 [Myxococcales bacterium]|nr:hypothetical protein [Myxococcales bacterium]